MALKVALTILIYFFVVSCGGGSNTTDTTVTSTGDSNSMITEGDTDEQLSNESTVNEHAVISDDTMLEGLFPNLTGAVGAGRVWDCEVFDSAGNVRKEFLEFGDMPEFNSKWARFVSSRGGVGALYRVTLFDEDTLRMTYPGIERVAPIFQNEENNRTRFLRDIIFSNTGSMTATFLERRLTEGDLLRNYSCVVSDQSRALSAELSVWPVAPIIEQVENFSYIIDQRIELVDNCNDGQAINVQLLEAFRGTLTGRVWPNFTDSVYVGSAARFTTIRCAWETSYCFSAETEGGVSSVWGIDPDPTAEDRSCSDCCYSCPYEIGIVPIKRISFTCG